MPRTYNLRSSKPSSAPDTSQSNTNSTTNTSQPNTKTASTDDKDNNQTPVDSPSLSSFTLTQTTTPLSSLPSSTDTTTTLLVHATNAFGTWGAGFAKAVREDYPNAEGVYKDYCDGTRSRGGKDGDVDGTEWPSRSLVGRCLVVEPQVEDRGYRGEGDGDDNDGEGQQRQQRQRQQQRGNIDSSNDGGSGVYIANLFSSYGYGSRAVKCTPNGGGHAAKDPPQKVKENTITALQELHGWIKEHEGLTGPEEGVGKMSRGKKDVLRTRKVVVYSPRFNSGNFGVEWAWTVDVIRKEFAEWQGEWRVLGDR